MDQMLAFDNKSLNKKNYASLFLCTSNTIVTTDRRQFTLLYLFYFSFFCIFFACLRFGSHFRSHDSHVTGEHMVELGGHFFFVFCKSKQFFNVRVHCIFKETSLVQVQEAVFRE